jgi:serine/threonine protein kinase
MNNIFNLNRIKKEYSNNSFLNNIIKKLTIEKVLRINNKNSRENNREYIKSIKLGDKLLTLKPYINSLEKYNIKNEKIASGSFGTVYNTTNPNIIFKKVKDPIKKKATEFKSLIFHYLLLEKYKNNIKKKYLCKLIEFGSCSPYQNKDYYYYYVVMEKFGKRLSDLNYNYNNPLLKINNLFKIFYQCCVSLSLIHELKYLHLDIKPENFLVNNNKIKIIDFGTANKNKFKTNELFGTIFFIANDWLFNFSEKKETELTYHHDIFSLGCMFIELLYKFMLNRDIFIACPLILELPNELKNSTQKYEKDYIIKQRINYDEESYEKMCSIIKIYLNYKFKTNTKIIDYIELSIKLIELMCHSNPEKRCKDIHIIIKELDDFFKKKKIQINENENIIVKRIN